MNRDECFELGYVIKTHGLVGEVALHLDVDDPSMYEDLGGVFIEIKNNLVPFFSEYTFFNNEKLVVKFEDVEDLESAEKLKGTKVFMPIERLPKLDGDKYYFHELLGYEVLGVDGNAMGKVTQIYEANAQSLLAFEHKGKEVLVPINDDILVSVDKAKKEVKIDFPDGLIDIYLED